MFRTAEGTKLAAAVLGRGVVFEIDGDDPGAGDAWSVVVKGNAVEIEQPQLVLRYALDLPLFPWHAGPKHRFVRIEPVAVTGRGGSTSSGARRGLVTIRRPLGPPPSRHGDPL